MIIIIIMLKYSRISYRIIGGTGVDELIKLLTHWIGLDNIYLGVGLVLADLISKNFINLLSFIYIIIVGMVLNTAKNIADVIE